MRSSGYVKRIYDMQEQNEALLAALNERERIIRRLARQTGVPADTLMTEYCLDFTEGRCAAAFPILSRLS